MVSSRRRSRRLESVLSIVIVCVLVFIGVFLFGMQFRAARTEVDVAALSPAGFEASLVEQYDAGNLYEKINGKAPLYTDCGFVGLSTIRFAAADDEEMAMEVYLFDMGTARGAFSVYSMQKRADTEDLETMEFGYRTSNGLYFTKGKYYVEVVGFSERPELMQAMEQIGGKLGAALHTDAGTGLAEIDSLPVDGKAAGSVTFYVSSAFGCEGLTEIFTCTYKSGSEELTAFLSKRAGQAEAERAANLYRDFLIENGAKPKEAINEKLDSSVLDFYGYIEIVARSGRWLVGVHEAQSQEAAEGLVLRIIEGLEN